MEMAVHAGRKLGLLQLQLRRAINDRVENDRGEGVISMAIAILVIAALGVAMWTAFKGFADSAAEDAESQLENIGG